MRRILDLFVLLLTGCFCLGAAGKEVAHKSESLTPPKVIILSWDGAPAWMVKKLLHEGKLPSLAQLKERGVESEYSVSNFPDPSTPCGHSTLWTGAPSSVHGITGFFMPALPSNQHTVLENQSGFNSDLLKAEPIWIPFLRAGRRVTLCHTPMQYPFAPWTTEKKFGANYQDRLTVIDGFGQNKIQSNRPELAKQYLLRVGDFIGKDTRSDYQKGLLGKTIIEGGEGSAEDKYLASVRRVATHFRRATLFAMRHTDWDLLICYTPFPDSAGHIWSGLLDPSSLAYRAAWAEKLWPCMTKVAQLCDQHLGAILFNAPPNTIVALVSDHGMIGIARRFYINTVLRKAGLIAVNARRQVDLSGTKIIYPPGGGSFLRINWRKYVGGIVDRKERDMIVRQTTQALLSVRDPDTGQPVVTGVLDGELVGPSLGFGDERTGDLMITLAPGYDFSDAVDKEEVIVSESPLHSGAHKFYPDHPSCRTIFFIAGPGVAQGKIIPPIHNADIAPTICQLAGVPPPAQATGKVIPAVFR